LERAHLPGKKKARQNKALKTRNPPKAMEKKVKNQTCWGKTTSSEARPMKIIRERGVVQIQGWGGKIPNPNFFRAQGERKGAGRRGMFS